MSLLSRAKVLSMYRQGMYLARHVQNAAQRAQMEADLRHRFRNELGVLDSTDATAVHEWLRRTDIRLQYIAMCTPKYVQRRLERKSGGDIDPDVLKEQRTGTYVYREGDDGKLEMVSGKAELEHMQWRKDMRLDPMDLKRHHKLLRRQHFLDR